MVRVNFICCIKLFVVCLLLFVCLFVCGGAYVNVLFVLFGSFVSSMLSVLH